MAATFKVVYSGLQTQKYGPMVEAAREITIIEMESNSTKWPEQYSHRKRNYK
ncbi:MAG: hypothetical protein HQ521_16405 [Bacteroidetes bacterium]|nr:hypothetical protein [Bacteroidota bacterium]